MKNKIAVIIVGHGSSDPAGNMEFEGVAAGYREIQPEWEITTGYIEHESPDVYTAVSNAAKRANTVVVAPMLLFKAGHARHDIPEYVERAMKEYPDVTFHLGEPLGTNPHMAKAMMERMDGKFFEGDKEDTTLIAIGRGSNNSDANSDFFKMSRLVGDLLGLRWTIPCFIGVTGPSLDEALDLVLKARPKRLAVAPYFLFSGKLVDRISNKIKTFSEANPDIMVSLGTRLGSHSGVLKTLDERILQALNNVSHSIHGVGIKNNNA